MTQATIIGIKRKRQLLLGLLGLVLTGQAFAQAPLLSRAQAFSFHAQLVGRHVLVLRWTAAPGYHLFRNHIHLRITPSTVHPVSYVLPLGRVMNIPGVGRSRVYEGTAVLRLALKWTKPAPARIVVTSRYQGCANAGVCYPPATTAISLVFKRNITQGSVSSGINTQSGVSARRVSPSLLQKAPTSGATAQFARGLQADGALFILFLFFMAGLGLAFTPCTFPMIPILSSLVVGQCDTGKDNMRRGRAFRISLAYVLGMAFTYTVVGVFAALTGSYLQAAFQNPWVLGSFSALFVVLALSMFGFYELQMPAAVQTYLARHGKGGQLWGALVMGVLSALIVGPCIAAPLAGALLFIARTGNVVLGASALFVLAIGMGIPLLVVGTSAGHFLPKAGRWMGAIKAVFGVVMLAMAIWFLSRILSGPVTLGLWSVAAVTVAVYLGAFRSSLSDSPGWDRLWQGLGLALFAYGLALGAGALAGGGQVFKPLAPFTAVHYSASAAPLGIRPRFEVVHSLAGLRTALSASNGRPALVDFSARWCVECQRMDTTTYDNSNIERALRTFHLIRVDVTAKDAASSALLRHFRLFGPPAILLANGGGKLVAQYEGYEDPHTLLRHLRKKGLVARSDKQRIQASEALHLG